MVQSLPVQLNEIADIRAGLTLRGRDAARKFDENGLHLLKISDITPDGFLRIQSPHPIPVTPKMDRFRLRPNDLVITNRGQRFTTAMVPPDARDIQAIASSQVFLLRPHPERVLPRYLWWFLNRPSTQRFLQQHARGTHINTVSIRILRQLAVPLPSPDTQHRIAELALLAHRESNLLAELAHLKSTYRDALLNNLITR